MTTERESEREEAKRMSRTHTPSLCLTYGGEEDSEEEETERRRRRRRGRGRRRVGGGGGEEEKEEKCPLDGWILFSPSCTSLYKTTWAA